MGGLSNKFSEAKRATRPYVDDRLTQTEATVVAYGVAAGLFGNSRHLFHSRTYSRRGYSVYVDQAPTSARTMLNGLSL
jgi:hypothetical protein